MVIPVMFFGYISSAGTFIYTDLNCITKVTQHLIHAPLFNSMVLGLLVAIFPSLSYLSALVISACLTPTDPILAAAIVGGAFADKNVCCFDSPFACSLFCLFVK